MDNLKWQIHAETALSQAAIWLVIGKLYGGWVWIPAAIFILGNLITMWRSVRQLPKGYLTAPSKKGKE